MVKYSPHTNFLGPEVVYPKPGLRNQKFSFNVEQQQQIVGQNSVEIIHISKMSINLEEGS